MIRHFLKREFLVFLCIGGLAAAINFLSRLVYNQWIDFSAAVILGYLTGMVVAFVLMRVFVFPKSSQSVRRSIVFFVMVNSVGMLQTFAVTMGIYYLLPLIGFNRGVSEIAHGIGIAAPIFSSYIGHKRFSFK
jgi:putative flippase GtrA